MVGSILLHIGACVAPPESGPSESWRIEVHPGSGETDASVWTTVEFSLDRRVFPQSPRAGAVRIRSGASVPRFGVEYDPVDLTIVVRPMTALLPGVAYTVTLDGLTDLDGRAQPEPFVSVFATGPEDSRATSTARGAVAWESVEDLFRRRCAADGCHAAEFPAARLDLSSAVGVEATAIGVPSRLFHAGTAASQVPRSVGTLAGLPLIDRIAGRGHPATSYLLYKVLGDPHVLGASMPPDGPPLAASDVELLRDWIRAGASTPGRVGPGSMTL